MKLIVQTASGKELVAGGIAVQPSVSPAGQLCRQPLPCCRLAATYSQFLVFLQDSVEDLQKQLQRRKSQYYPARQRLSLQAAPGEKRGQVLSPGTRLAEYNLQEGQVLIFKDLGPQVWDCRCQVHMEWHGSNAIQRIYAGGLCHCLLLGVLWSSDCLCFIVLST